jgi:hypothetical protein
MTATTGAQKNQEAEESKYNILTLWRAEELVRGTPEGTDSRNEHQRHGKSENRCKKDTPQLPFRIFYSLTD